MNYRKLIKLTKKTYKFINYNNIKNKENVVLWRHDIDFSVHKALTLAKIEKKENIKATYFIQISSQYYNIFEKENLEKIKKIKSLGHILALHFEPNNYDIKNIIEFEKWLEFEKKILEKLFNTKITVFSLHNPTTINFKFEKLKYSNMINVYSKFIKEKVGYCSDSNGYWRNERLEDVLTKTKHKKLQVLTHPVWWQKEEISPKKRIKKTIEERSKKTLKEYDQLLKKCGRKNIE